MHKYFFLITIPTLLLGQESQLVTATQTQDSRCGGQLTIQNNANQSITAFVYTFATGGDHPFQSYKFHESILAVAERAVPPKATLVARVGTPVVSMEFRAAVFADGSTFGDAAWAARIIHRRQLTLAAADNILSLLKSDLADPQISVNGINQHVAAYKAKHIEDLRQSNDLNSDEYFAFAYFANWISHNLPLQQQKLGTDTEAIVRRNIELVADIRSKLAAALAAGNH